MDEKKQNEYALEKVVRRLVEAVKEQTYINEYRAKYGGKNGL